MNPIDLLKKHNLIDWPTLIVGLRKGWVKKTDISDYAVKLLSSDLDNDDKNVALLATADSSPDEEVNELLLKLVFDYDEKKVLDKWMFAKLSELSEAELPEEETVDRLQKLYGLFDYPEDMASCSIYAQDSVDPLSAMSNVLSSLKKRLTN